MDVQPLGDRIALKRLEEEQRETDAGIVIPESAQGTPNQAEVVALGSGLEEADGAAPDLAEGDRVLVGEFAGQTINVDGQDLEFVEAENVLARIG